jgi:hypothetical protein
MPTIIFSLVTAYIGTHNFFFIVMAYISTHNFVLIDPPNNLQPTP